MNQHYTYFIIHAAALAGPLLLSFDRKVAFYKKWKYLFPAMLFPALFFLIWDEWFTRLGVWSFNPDYITGIRLGSLPIEEVLFFITVPYCCVFVYECIKVYFPVVQQKASASKLFFLMQIVLLVVGLLNIEKEYTSYTFLLNAGLMSCIFLFPKWFKGFNAGLFLTAYLVCLIPFLLVNGFLTAMPVVQYNDAENLGIRIFSFLPWPMHNIPFEDIFYGMLLILMNIVLFERRRTASVHQAKH